MRKQFLKNQIDEAALSESRRQFLKTIAYGSILALSGCGVEKAAILEGEGQGLIRHSHYRHRPGHRTLSFEHRHTGEKLKLTYCENGCYIKDALQEINYLLRDFHTDDVLPIDPELLDQLFDVKETLKFNKPFHILSGYRCPATNAHLRKHSSAVAEHSLHMKGRAIDIRVEGVTSKAIRNVALAMAQGGVGY